MGGNILATAFILAAAGLWVFSPLASIVFMLVVIVWIN